MAFAQIYVCPKHGEIINTHVHEAIDFKYDEVYHIRLCGRCTHTVDPLLDDKGEPVFRLPFAEQLSERVKDE
jgi:hypothetical protein